MTNLIDKAKAQVAFYKELFGRRAIDTGHINVENTQALVDTISQLLKVVEVQENVLDDILDTHDKESLAFLKTIVREAQQQTKGLLNG